MQSCNCLQSGMLKLTLSSFLLEIANDALWNTQCIRIGCSTLSQEFCRLIGLYWRLMRRQLWTLTCPIGKLDAALAFETETAQKVNVLHWGNKYALRYLLQHFVLPLLPSTGSFLFLRMHKQCLNSCITYFHFKFFPLQNHANCCQGHMMHGFSDR